MSFDLKACLQPTRLAYGYASPDHWCWCGSAIKGDDGKYHMFSARWPKKYPFFSGYVVSSEIVHAVSDTPYGPYAFREVVLGDRGEKFWDGRMTHNPSIIKCGDTYVLFYIGATYSGPRPTVEALYGETKDPRIDACYATIRIGAATAKSLDGPWTRLDAPIFERDPDGWDRTVVTNPAPCICRDGSILMYYRSNTPEGLRIGVARAKDASLNFERIIDHPILLEHPELRVEDPFVWEADDGFHMIAKDMKGTTGEVFGGVHLVSPDGIAWEYAEPMQAYSRTIRLMEDDGSIREETAYHLERPNLTFEDGKPIFMTAAYGADGGEVQPFGGKFDVMRESRTLVIPIA